MTIIDKAISRKRLTELAQNFYGEMIKGVVDIDDRLWRWMPNCILIWRNSYLRMAQIRNLYGGSTCTLMLREMTSLNSTHLSTSALEEITSAEMWKMRRYVVKSVQ